MKGPSFSKGRYLRNSENTMTNFQKIIFQISTKLGTKHPWVKGIQVCSVERFRPFPRGNDHELMKIHGQIWKSYSPEPVGQFNKIWQKVSLVVGDSSLFKWRNLPFLMGDNYEIVNIHWQIKKKKRSSPEPVCKCQQYFALSILGWSLFKLRGDNYQTAKM